MAHIYIRGQKPIKVTRERAEKIKTMFDDDSVSTLTVIAFEGFSIRKEDIKYIMLEDEDDKQQEKIDKGTNYVNEIEKRHQDNIDKRLALSIKERACILFEFTKYFSTLFSRNPNEEEKKEAIKLQYDFFSKNDIAYPQLYIFKPIIEKTPGMLSKLNPVQKMFLDILNRHCQSAIGRVSRQEYAQTYEQSNLL